MKTTPFSLSEAQLDALSDAYRAQAYQALDLGQLATWKVWEHAAQLLHDARMKAHAANSAAKHAATHRYLAASSSAH